MSEPAATLGRTIAEARKKLGMSQKVLAEKILREEDGSPISPQYLNDIEHDRRSPSSDHMIQQFAGVLGLSESYLYYLADRVPAQVRKIGLNSIEVEKWVNQAAAFRRSGSAKKR